MKKARLAKGIHKLLQGRSKGLTLVEIIIAIALIAIIGVAFLGGLSNAMWSLHIADVRTTAESLARSEMEHAKSLDYSEDYEEAITEDYVTAGYDSEIQVARVEEDDPDLQVLTVTVKHNGKLIVTLVGYRANR